MIAVPKVAPGLPEWQVHGRQKMTIWPVCSCRPCLLPCLLLYHPTCLFRFLVSISCYWVHFQTFLLSSNQVYGSLIQHATSYFLFYFFSRLAELPAHMSFYIMLRRAIFSQTLKLGYAYMTNWCGARAVLHTSALTRFVWATVLFLQVCLGGKQRSCGRWVIKLRFMWFVFPPPASWCSFKLYDSTSDSSSQVTLSALSCVLEYVYRCNFKV